MNLISWNVNGLRACVEKGFPAFFQASQADVFCVQETKLQPGQLELDTPGYYQYWNSAEKKGYSGTAVFSRIKPNEVSYGIGIPAHDTEGRVITLYYDTFTLVNVYTPNSQRELTRLAYRMEWEDAFRAYLLRLEEEAPVVVCGDMNVAHKEIDLKNPKTNVGSAGFTNEERDKMSQLLDAGFADSFRRLHPDTVGAYTWWSYMYSARSRNTGWRIDYFLVSERLAAQIEDSLIYADIMGSDHCPVGLKLRERA